MKIRNFSIIAHIDHGKSTLADRMLQRAHAVNDRDFQDQLLDDMDLERERGITIKASAVTLHHRLHGEDHMLNFIDTPGHVDFSYEVSRALAACEGAILVVDATQGVEAQTVANAYLAVDHDLEIIPVINKIDLPSARPDDVAMEVEQLVGIPAEDCYQVSAKSGQGVEELLAAICEKVPDPRGDPDAATRALIVDSEYDDYQGVIVYFRLFDGALAVGDRIRMMRTGRTYPVNELGKFTPRRTPFSQEMRAGEVGYLIGSIKQLGDVHVGDTITRDTVPATEPLPGYREPQAMVFCDFYPTGNTQYHDLRDAVDRLHLNDASFTYVPQTNEALGFGLRCGFLGMLHMDIIQERLEREHGVELLQTAPTTTYEILVTDGGEEQAIRINNPSDLPDPSKIKEVREPIASVEFITPEEGLGDLMHLCESRRGRYKRQEVLAGDRQLVQYEMPLAEILFDFYDRMKSITRGYGTMDYKLEGFRADKLVKVDILVNHQRIDALSFIAHRNQADQRGRSLLQRLQQVIERHMFEIPLQAAIGGKVIARETIKAMSKNVTAKCYGGDVSRKRKLIEQQKEGKKRMKRVGTVDLPQEAFMAVMGAKDESS